MKERSRGREGCVLFDIQPHVCERGRYVFRSRSNNRDTEREREYCQTDRDIERLCVYV